MRHIHMRSIGMGAGQLYKMIAAEAATYAVLGCVLGLPLNKMMFPFLQMGLFLLVLFGMEVILSVWTVRRQKKQSLVEQMRAQS